MKWEKVLGAYDLDIVRKLDDETFIVDTGILYLVHFRRSGYYMADMGCWFVDEYIVDDIFVDWQSDNQNVHDTVRDILTNGVPLRSVPLCKWLTEE